MSIPYTEGPWSRQYSLQSDGREVRGARWHIMAGRDRSIHITSLKAYDEMDDANAVLVEFSPRMYGLLQDVWSEYQNPGTHNTDRLYARVAALLDDMDNAYRQGESV